MLLPVSRVDKERLVDNDSDREKVVYVVPTDEAESGAISIFDLGEVLWRARLWVLGSAAIFAIAAIAYSLLATEWYRAEVLLIPNESQSSQSLGSQLPGLGGLANLAGINVQGRDATEALAVLRSRQFTRSFIEDKELLPVFFSEEWNSDSGEWNATNPQEQPDLRDGVKYFQENVREVSEDSRSGLVTLSISWTDADLAAEWAMELVSRLNATMRMRALEDAERNITYLQSQLESTNIGALRDAVARLLESELQKVMLARGEEEFAFRIVDPAKTPKLRYWPKRSLIVILATVIGGLLASIAALVSHAMAQRQVERESS